MDSDDIYHIDFTTASNIEVFIARIEEIFVEWNVPQLSSDIPLKTADFNTAEWTCKEEAICLMDPDTVYDRSIDFKLSRYSVAADDDKNRKENETTTQAHFDLSSAQNDFCNFRLPPAAGPHPLARWYGLSDFIVLIPQNAYDVDSETKVKTLLSCIQIAVTNSECSLPVFLQAALPWQFYFIGTCRTRHLFSDFEMVHLERTPSHSKYLTGLLTLFKTKIGRGVYAGPVTIAVRFTYVLKEWVAGTWTPEKIDRDYLGGDVLDFSEIGQVPFGARCDPFEEIALSAIWPRLLDNAVVDTETYSDLEPFQAPEWRLTVHNVPDLSSLLTDYYSEFLTLGRSESKLAAVTRALTGLRGVQASGAQDGPIPMDVLMSLLYFLFPDADQDASSPTYPDYISARGDAAGDEEMLKNSTEAKLKGIKGVPYGSLPWRLAILMAHVVHSLGGVRSGEHLWHEFTQELRYRCENAIMIPGLEPGFPDPRSCLLNQKLQLLNCCISRRIEREKQALNRVSGDEEEEEEDEFFDASDSVPEASLRKKVGAWNQPTGRLSKHGDLLLLETGEPMYVPKTQDPVPRTEDQLEEHADILVQLGTDAEGSAMRALLMSASLLSDMEAFKAANPGCVMADFIRWFSPRDWIEEDENDEHGQKKGYLSSRMTIPGNTWEDVWKVAYPIPARCQKRLFDDTKEMEKALRYLEGQAPPGFSALLLPVLTSCVLVRLYAEASIAVVPGIREALDRLFKRTQRLSRLQSALTKNYEELTSEICGIESRLIQFHALYNFFLQNMEEDVVYDDDVLKKFVSDLVVGENVIVPGGPRSCFANVLQRVLCRSHHADANKISQTPADKSRYTYSSFPSPTEKEIILRAQTNKGPQRLFAAMKKHEYRLCGAFTNFSAFF